MKIEGTLYSPDGDEIIGTSERVFAAHGCAFSQNEAGDILREEDGSGSQIFWETSQTHMRDGKVLYWCRAGLEWTLDECIFVPDGQTFENVMQAKDKKTDDKISVSKSGF